MPFLRDRKRFRDGDRPRTRLIGCRTRDRENSSKSKRCDNQATTRPKIKFPPVVAVSWEPEGLLPASTPDTVGLLPRPRGSVDSLPSDSGNLAEILKCLGKSLVGDRSDFKRFSWTLRVLFGVLNYRIARVLEKKILFFFFNRHARPV
ncbi:hypothetical protein PUN28_013120 [Cardiocondyla obscurior]|uniref:Uncharacterized protein n=1 Tax=Cardiocondyla obscurior TaxID=286306 RepID=A0AAW2FCM8_9HYME